MDRPRLQELPADDAIAGVPPPRLGRMLLVLALAILALLVLHIVLGLPGGLGVEDFLGHGRSDGALMCSVAEAWANLVLIDWGPMRATLRLAAWLYFVLDTVFLVPLYGVLLLEVARRIALGSERRDWRHAHQAALLIAVATLLLMAVDVVENTSGLVKLGLTGMPLWLVWPSALAAPLLGWRLWQRGTEGRAVIWRLQQLSGQWAAAPGMLRGLTRAVVLAIAGLLLLSAVEGSRDFALSVGAASHLAKLGLAGLLALIFLALGLVWIFASQGRGAGHAMLRRGLADIVWRTRYVLTAQLLLVGMTLVSDQCRDVMVGVADGLFVWPQALWAWSALALSVLAVWAMSFSCWLWARLACRMPGPGRDPLSPTVEQALSSASQAMARLLGVGPLLAAALMAAWAARDAVWAGMRLHEARVASPLVLLVFGLACVLGGLLFLWGRERVSASTASPDYYDDPSMLPNWVAAVSSTKYSLAWAGGPGPVSLPLIALALAVALRSAVALQQPGVPFAYPVVVFSLVGWLGLFGWLSMKEQREARPWLLLLVALVGVAGWAGLTDNHLVRLVTPTADAQLPPVLAQVIGSALLLACIVLAAVLLVRRSAMQVRGRGVHWSAVFGGLLLAGTVVLGAVDRITAVGAPAQAPEPRATVDDAIAQWLDAIWVDPRFRAPGQRVFFVASEGGGIRAAYWTARTLMVLREQVPGFDQRSFMLSGVSGGAVGEAVYLACTLQPRLAGAACVDGFGRTDLLTPLLGAWLFEDALARLLPTTLPSVLQDGGRGPCVQAGCGFLSRGLWFEQALEQAVPALALGLARSAQSAAQAGAHLPRLFLNSTWVESGERTIASSVQAGWPLVAPVDAGAPAVFAGARDPLSFAAGQGAALDLPLSTAAHNAARFPFVNAIGLLRSADGRAGHLADGGYFDNSGTQTVVDALAALRAYVARQRCDHTVGAACQDKLVWLRSLRPTVIVIQNGVAVDCHGDTRLACLRQSWGLGSADHAPYQPGAPVEAGQLRLYADAIGPLLTLLNAGGSGANGRRAEALLARDCARFDPAHPDCVVRLAQRADGVLYPLGWYLSPTARAALDAKARREVAAAALD